MNGAHTERPFFQDLAGGSEKKEVAYFLFIAPRILGATTNDLSK
jgi:hypothetical protein